MTELELMNWADYRVEDDDGEIGRVAAVLPSRAGHGPSLLIQVADGPACGLSAVSPNEVEFADAAKRRLVLRVHTPSSETAMPTP
jgi:hypothetical protein